ncbi:MAG: signal peptidase II [Ignavibacteria bacterium]
MKVLLATLFIVICDQVTKLYVKGISIPALGIDIKGMPYQSSFNIIGDFFKITYIENPGMAFGLQIGGKLFLSLFTIVATILLLFFLYKNRKEGLLLRLALALILGGAVGNLIDRVFYGKIYSYAPFFYGRVVDFLHFDFPNFTIFGKTIYSWPIFNVADIAVSAGFLLILFGYKKIFGKEIKPGPEDTGDYAVNDHEDSVPDENFSGELKSEELNNLQIIRDIPGSEPDNQSFEKKID